MPEFEHQNAAQSRSLGHGPAGSPYRRPDGSLTAVDQGNARASDGIPESRAVGVGIEITDGALHCRCGRLVEIGVSQSGLAAVSCPCGRMWQVQATCALVEETKNEPPVPAQSLAGPANHIAGAVYSPSVSIVVWAQQAVDRWRRQSGSFPFERAMTEAAGTLGAVIDCDRNRVAFLRVATAIRRGQGNAYSDRAALVQLVESIAAGNPDGAS